MFKRFRNIILGAALLLPALATIMAPGIAHASPLTLTWTGGGSDGNWDTAANWTGGALGHTFPANGDTIVIDNAAAFTNGCVDDINGLSLAGINFINNAGGGTVDVTMAASTDLTLTGDVTQDSTVTTTSDNIGNVGSLLTGDTITLGADVHFTYNAGTNQLGATGITANDIIDLNGHTLTFDEVDSNSSAEVDVNANITDGSTGAGLVFNGPNTDYVLGGTDDYDGTTTVTADNSLSALSAAAFGTSDITIATAGSIVFHLTNAVSPTISNNIAITGVASGATTDSIAFSDTNGVLGNFTVPNITLNGNTGLMDLNFSANSSLVNLAGITANGHCIDYSSDANVASNAAVDNGFQNGATACTASSGGGGGGGTTTTTPATPKTGFGVLTSQPGLILLATTLLSGSILVISRRYSTLSK